VTFNPEYKYGNVIEGKPEELETKLIPVIMKDARKVLPKGTEFSINIYQDKWEAAVAWRYPVTAAGRDDLINKTVIA
jgi:hypothetical protein